MSDHVRQSLAVSQLPESRNAKLKRLFQPAVAVLRWEGVVLLAAVGFGIVSALATRWFLVFILFSAGFLYMSWARAYGDSRASKRFRLRARKLGLWVWAALLGLIGLAIFWRFSQWWSAALFGVIYIAIGVWHLKWLYQRNVESAMQFRQAIALSVLPIFFAWFVNSTLFHIYAGMASRFRLQELDDSGWDARLDARRAVLSASDATVAVTLSGGGYRAAAVHAGILSTLEEAGMPVDYLSTVSGGSIVGASYAMGMSGEDFGNHLKNARPGLPNDLINFYQVFAQLLVPGYGSGDTYANHFDRVFFQSRTLEDTGPPLLIINTTQYRDGTRRAFMAENGGQLALGRLVAASGAFPVAFDPVPIEGELYVDGGVVENLGVAGLQYFLESHAADPDIGARIPKVLILSDAGLIPEAPPAWTKPSVLQMAMRAQQTSYFAMHRWIYSFYTDGAYDRAGDGPVEQPFEVTAGRLWPGLGPEFSEQTVDVFVLSPSSPGERGRFAGNEALLDAVSDLDTLKELSPREVDAAFWVGGRMAQAYLPALCAAAAIQCRPVTLGEAPPVPD
jgi:predicted acylesterase/phospholipase RssA